MAIAGDKVLHEEQELIVVDVTDDGFAVLRRPDDMELLQPVVAEAASLRVIGHEQFIEGWVELAPGEWEQS